VGAALSSRRSGRARAVCERPEGQQADARRRPAQTSGDRCEASRAASGHATRPRCARTIRGARCRRSDGASRAARRGPDRSERRRARSRSSTAATFRTCSAESAVAVGPLHLPAATTRAALSGRLHGRPLALSRRPRARASSTRRARARGLRARARPLRHTAGGAHRSRPAVHDLARADGLRGAAAPQRNPPSQEPPAASADAGQDRAFLEDAVGRVSLAHRLRRLRRLRAATRPLRRSLQLPPAPPSARRLGARRSLLPRCAAGACCRAGDDRRQRAAAGARAAAGEALLSGGSARRPRAEHRGDRWWCPRAHGRGTGRDDSHQQGAGR
jgi:hypothetical protein